MRIFKTVIEKQINDNLLWYNKDYANPYIACITLLLFLEQITNNFKFIFLLLVSRGMIVPIIL